MGGYVDIHAHVLPGIDDGPDDLEQSLELLRAAADSGTATIAATPHLRSDFPNVHIDDLSERCAEVRVATERAGIPIEVICGAEVSAVWAAEASHEQLALASYRQAGGDLLLETPTIRFVGLGRLVDRLMTAGFRVTLAHPERSLDFQDDWRRLHELVASGVLLQVNADSLLGSADRATRRLARDLVRRGLAHAIASDGHRGSSWRAVTRLAQAVDVAVQLVGKERARWLTESVPAAIVVGAELPLGPPLSSKRKRWWPF